MVKPLDLTNQTFGYLTALSPTDKRDKDGNIYWACKCNKCGKSTEAIARDLKKGNRTSCGCAVGEIARKKNKVLADSFDGTNPNQQKMKIPKSNTTGVKGVSKYYQNGLFKGYRAYIFLKGKQIHGGVFDSLEEAKNKRSELETKYFGLQTISSMDIKKKRDILMVQEFYNKHGRPPLIKEFGNKSRAMMNRHGSWNDLIIEAGYEPTRLKNKEKWTKESLSEFAKNEAVNGELNFNEFKKRNLAVDLFGSWEKFLVYTGLEKKLRTEPNYLNKPFTTYTFEELLEHLRRRQEDLGRAPTTNDVTIFSYYVDKFGTWNNALRQAGIDGNYGWGKYTKSELVDMAQQQCDDTGYLSTGKFTHYYQAVKMFESWENFKKEAGLLNKKK